MGQETLELVNVAGQHEKHYHFSSSVSSPASSSSLKSHPPKKGQLSESGGVGPFFLSAPASPPQALVSFIKCFRCLLAPGRISHQLELNKKGVCCPERKHQAGFLTRDLYFGFKVELDRLQGPLLFLNSIFHGLIPSLISSSSGDN